MSWKRLATALMISRGITNWPPGMLPMREARAAQSEPEVLSHGQDIVVKLGGRRSDGGGDRGGERGLSGAG